MIHVDIPAPTDLRHLAESRHAASVSIYLPTTPVSIRTDGDRIALKNLGKEAVEQLERISTDRRAVAEIAEEIDDLVDDDEFWRFQAHGLAVFVTPENLRTFRVATRLEPRVGVSDRFHLKPLLRSVTFGHACIVLALAESSVRVVEVSADLPAEAVRVAGMPSNAPDAVGKASISSRSHSGRLVGSEGKKVRLRQYARCVDGALRGLLAGSDLPLVLATVESLGAIYRSVNSYPHLAAQGIEGNPERLTETELAAAARPVLDALARTRISDWRERFAQRVNAGRTTSDIAAAARAATAGAVESMVADMDAIVYGAIDDESGEVRFAESASADTYDIVDEIARRVLLSGGTVMPVRSDEAPEARPLSAILRYPIG
jgi:hypothetical protein